MKPKRTQSTYKFYEEAIRLHIVPLIGKKRVSFCPDSYWHLADGIEYRECQGSLLWTRPKTLAGKRMVPIMKPRLATLEVHREQTADWPNPHNLVWHRRDGRSIGEKQVMGTLEEPPRHGRTAARRPDPHPGGEAAIRLSEVSSTSRIRAAGRSQAP